MDQHLISLARAVKRRRRARHPTLWLFSDERRQPDLLAAIAALPRGISGVVFRHDGAPGRAALARQVAALCRSRRITLVIAGDWRLAAALGAGVHLRGGVPPRARYRGAVNTASAHDCGQMIAARGVLASLVFLSPAFATASHPGAGALGPVRWAALARRCRVPVLALGGVTGVVGRRFGEGCGGFGAIEALSSE
ncbi:MAG: thiamine phosphate synthase [Acidiphilium sp. 37-64-53]|uniref:thiamine phosphate synthase n=1 Tax=Acidiphilium TaxID=522 RepID=UPI000BDD4044|nr:MULTISPECIES: thiamine phosphate synthase [Acidiphilium]OYW02001.1 MAG: thiamine phosphate synthase [Acidiphilium sp. 37-64-53]OZB26733.1 MAG: thiamine phosphate synthase [Acidiphilium sp. 34-64-41]HQT85403.1 thiamine phosphate synthase [Acidiphilium rubrum]